MNWLLSLLGGGLVEKITGPLVEAYKAKLSASNDNDRLAAEERIAEIESDLSRIAAARDIALAETANRWSATSMGRWLIAVPFGIWYASILLVQILNPWVLQPLFGITAVVIDIPPRIYDISMVLVPAIIIADAGAIISRRFGK